MHRTQHRFTIILAATTAALAIAAAPALAGSSGCAGGDCQDENSPAQVVPVLPTPVAPAPLPATGGGNVSPEHSSRTVTIAQTVPRGSVSAGAGGTAAQGPDGLLAGLGGAGLVLIAAGGGMVASSRSARP
jgi:hypothetical protein